MNAFMTIITEIIVPVFILMGIGVVLQRKFRLDLYTLAKLNLYVLVPGIIFVKLYETAFAADVFLYVLLFFVITSVLLYGASRLVSRLFRLEDAKKTVMVNSTLFYNSGNYGIPVNDLVFRGDPFAASIQIWVLAFQNLFTFTYGIFTLQKLNVHWLQALLGYLRSPVFFAMSAGIGLNLADVTLPEPIMVPIRYVANALVAIALITLGAQVANLQPNWRDLPIYGGSVLRLLVGPAIALGVIMVMRLDGVIAQALLIASAMPTSVNSAIIAQEYKTEPQFAAQLVTVSTIISSLTVSFVILMAQLLY
jgi:predicted permease